MPATYKGVIKSLRKNARAYKHSGYPNDFLIALAFQRADAAAQFA